MRYGTSPTTSKVVAGGVATAQAIFDSVLRATPAGGAAENGGDSTELGGNGIHSRSAAPDPLVKNHVRRHGRPRSKRPATTWIDTEGAESAVQ